MGCVISSWKFFWLVGGEAIRSQHHQSYGSNRSGVYMLVGSIQLTSSTWWGFQYLKNSSEDMTQNISYSPWGGTKGLMAKHLLFCLAWLFPFFLHFLTSLIKYTIWSLGEGLKAQVFLQTRGRPRTLWEWSVLGRPHRVLLNYNMWHINFISAF